MIIVTGGVTARAESFDAALREACAHVARSLTEDGCLFHSVHIDADNPRRLFFYEEWRDMAALTTHFEVPESGAFMTAMRGLCDSMEPIRILEAAQRR
jgi:quinol monooxygenase YgiN